MRRRWYLHQYKVAADMDAHWPEFTSMDGRRPAAEWAPYWDSSGSRSAAASTRGSRVGPGSART